MFKIFFNIIQLYILFFYILKLRNRNYYYFILVLENCVNNYSDIILIYF